MENAELEKRKKEMAKEIAKESHSAGVKVLGAFVMAIVFFGVLIGVWVSVDAIVEADIWKVITALVAGLLFCFVGLACGFSLGKANQLTLYQDLMVRNAGLKYENDKLKKELLKG